ncbi:MAG: LptF/LptG family permease [Acidobacteriota bacterium]
MLKRLDSYIFREILGPSILSLALYIFLLFMTVLFEVAREAVENQLALGVILRLLYYQLPQLLVVSLPMSILLGTLIGVGRLSSDSELLAMQAAGVRFRRLFLAPFLLGLLGTAISFYFIAVVAPQGTYLHHLMKREVYLSRYVNTDRIGPRIFHESIPGLLLYYDAREPETGGLQRVFIYEKDPTGESERITVARRGEMSFDQKTGRVNLFLEDGSTHTRRFDAGPKDYSVITFNTYQESREPPAYIRAFSRNLQRNHREMSTTQLMREIQLSRQDPNPVARRIRVALARTHLHERFALPAAAIIFALLGLPLGVVNRRGSKASGFALSLAIVLVYWVSYSVLHDLAQNGRMDAVLALWLPNMVFLALALLLMFYRGGRQWLFHTAALGLTARLWQKIREWQPARRRVPPPRPLRDSPPSRRLDAAPRFPLLIDLHLISIFFRVFLFVLLTVYMVFLLVEFRSLVQDMMYRTVPLHLIIKYLVFLVPRMTTTILPVACLVGTLVALGLMARGREDTAVKAAGVSIYRLLLPLLTVTLLICAFGYFLQDKVLPTSNRVAESLRDRIAGRSPRNQNPRHRWVMGDGDRLYHFEGGSPKIGVLQGLSIHQLDPVTFALRTRIEAARARYDGHSWIFQDGWERVFTPDGSDVNVFQRREVNLGVTPAFFQNEDTVLLWGIQREPDQMSYHDQRNYIRDLARRGYETTSLRVALARKVSFPIIPFFMVLLGFPFSFMVGSRGSLFGIGLSIGLTVVYWAALAVFNALGTAEILPPLLAAWAPNIFFGGLGIYLILHVRT